MPKMQIRRIGLKGLNTDVVGSELAPEHITVGVNFRVYAGKLAASGGALQYLNPLTLDPLGHLFFIVNGNASYWLLLGETSVLLYDGTNIINITGEAFNVPNSTWSVCQLSKIPVVNNPSSYPSYYDATNSTQLTPLPYTSLLTWKDKGFHCNIMRSHKNFLFALNLQEGALTLTDGLRWSHPADINGLPFTWDESDPSSLAGRAQLGGDGGAIVDGRSLKDSFLIYSEKGIDRLDFIGGDFVWQRTEISNSYGLLSPNSIVEVNNLHYFLSDGDCLTCDGTRVQSLMHGRILTEFSHSINPDAFSTSYVVSNEATKEVWFCVPVADTPIPSVAYIYSWASDSWAVRKLGKNGVIHAGYGKRVQAQQTWDNWLGSWDDQKTAWDYNTLTPRSNSVIGIIDNELYVLDSFDFNSTEFDPTVLERTDLSITDEDVETTITAVYPRMEGSGTVLISIGSQDHNDGPVRWKPAVEYDVFSDRKIDLRSTGNYHCWRIESKDNGSGGAGDWTLAGMEIIYEFSGVR